MIVRKGDLGISRSRKRTPTDMTMDLCISYIWNRLDEEETDAYNLYHRQPWVIVKLKSANHHTDLRFTTPALLKFPLSFQKNNPMSAKNTKEDVDDIKMHGRGWLPSGMINITSYETPTNPRCFEENLHSFKINNDPYFTNKIRRGKNGFNSLFTR